MDTHCGRLPFGDVYLLAVLETNARIRFAYKNTCCAHIGYDGNRSLETGRYQQDAGVEVGQLYLPYGIRVRQL